MTALNGPLSWPRVPDAASSVSETFYGLYFVDQTSGALAVSWFRSAAAGATTQIPCSLWLQGGRLPADADQDGLSDLAEEVIGSDSLSADSDGDGTPDRIELASGTNPSQLDPLPTGPVARAEFGGTAQTITVAENHAFVGTAQGKLAVLELDGTRPPLLKTQFATPNPVLEVAIEGSLAALALGDSGVQILDVSDPAQPRLLHHLVLPDVLTVAIHGGWVIVGSGDDLLVLDPKTGAVRSRLDDLSGSIRVEAIAPEGDWLYVLTNDGLVTLWFENGMIFPTSFVVVSGRNAPLEAGRKLLVTDRRAYVGYFEGYAIFDLANQSLPVLRGRQPVTQAAIHHLAAASPRFLLPVTSFAGTTTLAVSLYDVADPSDVTRFQTSFDTPGEARALAVHHGLAFVADGSRGLTAVNFLPRGSDSVPPTVTLADRWAAPNPAVEPGSSQHAPVAAVDGTLVRDVALLLDGTVVARDGGHPFDLRFTAPATAPGKTNFTLVAVAQDLNGNTRTSAPVQVALVADATPPLLETIYPPGGSTSWREFLTEIAVTFGEVPAHIPPDALRVFGAGPDGVLFTADDIPLAGLGVRLQGRNLTWTPTTNLASGTYRAELAAGIADATGNTRREPLTWIFTLNNTRPQLNAVSPNGKLPTHDTLVSNLIATLSLPLPPSRVPELALLLTSAGTDGIIGNSDDRTNRLTSIVQEPALASFRLGVDPPLGVGTYRLRLQGAPVTSRTVNFSLLDPRSIWRTDTSGRWSDQTKWTLPPGADSQVIISRPNVELSVTNSSVIPLIRSLVCDERFVHVAGDFQVRDEAVFHGPVHWGGDETVFDDAAFMGGTFRFRGGLDILSTLVGNRRTHLGAATVINEATMRWTSGQFESSSSQSLLVNSPGATFEIGGTARDWEALPSTRARLLNAGWLRKTHTNTVHFSGATVENSGRISVEQGALKLTSLLGGGATEVLAGATLEIYRDMSLPPGARLHGDGMVILGFDTANPTNGTPADIRGTWGVAGITEVRHSGARFLSSLDLPRGTLRIGGNATLETPARLGRLEIDISPTARTGIVNAPVLLGELHFLQGNLAGPAPITVTDRLHLIDGILGSGDNLVLAGRATGNSFGSLRIDDRLLRIAADTELEAHATNSFAILPVRENIRGGFRIDGLLRVTGTNAFELAVAVTNSGRIRLEEGTLRIRRGIAPGGLFALQGTYLQEPDAILELAGGTCLFDSSQTRANPGIVRGVGTITVPTGFGGEQFVLSGQFHPGNPTGTLTVGPGRLGLNASALTVFQISAAGTAEVRASARLNGRLRLVFAATEPVAVGSRWPLFTGPRTGTFSEIEVVGLPADRRVEILYLDGQVVAEVRSP